jgi:hypothetical protein
MGMWRFDDPAYVSQMARFIRTHARLEFVSYYYAAPGSRFDLASKPRARTVYRRQIVPLGKTP